MSAFGLLEPPAQNCVRLEQFDRGARDFDIPAQPSSDLVGGLRHGGRDGLLPGHGRGIEPDVVGHYHRQTDHHSKGDGRSGTAHKTRTLSTQFHRVASRSDITGNSSHRKSLSKPTSAASAIGIMIQPVQSWNHSALCAVP